MKPTLKIKEQDGNWVIGTFMGTDFSAKIYQAPSHYGIDGGRVSKLFIKFGDEEIIYERGWSRGEIARLLWEPLVALLEIYAQGKKFAKGLES